MATMHTTMGCICEKKICKAPSEGKKTTRSKVRSVQVCSIDVTLLLIVGDQERMSYSLRRSDNELKC